MLRRLDFGRGLILGALVLGGLASRSEAQPPSGTSRPSMPRDPSLVGPPLGASGALGDGESNEPIGGRAGSSAGRVPRSLSSPAPNIFAIPEGTGVGTPRAVPITDVPIYGSLSLPTLEEEGPTDGLTLDIAIDRLIRENLDLRGRSLEIPQADADILTASLRYNPIFYADSQLVPYGSYTEARPGGQTQYDVNVLLPFDVTGKRKARTLVAQRAKRVVEAQYQDAVRVQIDNLYTAYVNALAARETFRYAQASLEGLNAILDVTQKLQEQGVKTSTDVKSVQVLRDAAAIGVIDSEEAYRADKRTLSPLLNLQVDAAEELELRGTIRDLAPPPPPSPELVSMAMQLRPDLNAYRLGVHRAHADFQLARANRLENIYVLYQPYTFQDNAHQPQSATGKNSTSWALGVTVPVPIFDRNQGNIRRAAINIDQTRVELASLEQSVATEVQQASREYGVSREALDRIRQGLLPAALQVRDDTYRLFRAGEQDILVYLNAQRDYNETVRQYRDTVVRHRRSMLRLNTVVGARLLP